MSTEEKSIELFKGSIDELMNLGDEAKEAGDVEAAIKYYEKAGIAGNTDGFAAVGLLYQYGEGVELSHDTALSWYQKIIDAGDTDGYWLKGNTYREMENFDAAVDCYEKAFDGNGNCKKWAAFELAKAYHYGEGKEENSAKALELYHLAAGNGLDSAMLTLAQLFDCGEIVQEDDESAFYWYERARDAGNEEADQYIKITRLLDTAEAALDSDDDELVFKSLKEAADLGDDNSMVLVGKMCKEGFSGESNPEMSFEYFLKAAEAGNADGMIGVAAAYANGSGVDCDKDKALEWFQKAAEVSALNEA